MKKTLCILLSFILATAVLPAFTVTAEQTDDPFVSEYIDNGYVAPTVTKIPCANVQQQVYASVTESRYDSREKGVLPKVKNQGAYGTCWAFSLVTAAEAGLISKGIARADEIDLSELQLCRFLYNTPSDPLGNFTGDKVVKKSNNASILEGGNHVYASKALERWSGLTDEVVLPYETDCLFADRADIPDEFASDFDEYRLKNFYALNVKKNPDEVKANIKRYGAVATSYYNDNRYFSSDKSAYYQNLDYGNNGVYLTNHAVCIVGWDDDYPSSSFAKAKPENDGAWLIMNSWGEDRNDKGFFWLSYEDNSVTNAYVFEFDSADKYDYNYMYDGGIVDSVYGPEFAYNGVVNIFTAVSDEKLTAVGFDLSYSANVDYEVKIFVNPSKNFYSNDTPVAVLNGNEKYAGYHTVELPESVGLKKGDIFAVAVTGRSGDKCLSFPVDSNASDDNITSSIDTSAEDSYVIDKNDRLCSLSKTQSGKCYTARVKAYTITAGMQDPENFCAVLDPDNNVTLSWDPCAGAEGYEIYCGTDLGDYSLLAVTDKTSYTYAPTAENGILLKYKVRAVGEDEKSIFSLSRAVRLENSVRLEGISLEDITVENYYTAPIKCDFYPYEATDKLLVFTSSDENVVLVDKNGVIKAVGEGYATVTALSRDNCLTAKCSVYVTEHVDHVPFVSVEKKEPTCIEEGMTEEISCALCGEVMTESASLGFGDHNYCEWTTIEPTCTREGYKTYICSVCNTTKTGETIQATGHSDKNEDGVCDNCEYDFTENCSCNCHKSGIVKFFWRILNIFNRIFVKNRLCSCGARHW